MIRIAVSLLLITCGAAYAETRTYIDGSGTKYSYSVNENGAVLTPMDGSASLYLGRSCDAYSQRYGAGRWGWAGGGFVIEFPEQRLGFARQELFPHPAPDSGCML